MAPPGQQVAVIESWTPLLFTVRFTTFFHCTAQSGRATQWKSWENEKVTQLFHWTQSTLGGNEKVWRFYFFFILLNSLLSGSRSGAPKKGTQGIRARQKPCFLPNFFFFIWTELTAGQLLDSWRNGETLFFFFSFLFSALPPTSSRMKKFSQKPLFFFIELNCRRGRAEWKKKRLWNALYLDGKME